MVRQRQGDALGGVAGDDVLLDSQALGGFALFRRLGPDADAIWPREVAAGIGTDAVVANYHLAGRAALVNACDRVSANHIAGSDAVRADG